MRSECTPGASRRKASSLDARCARNPLVEILPACLLYGFDTYQHSSVPPSGIRARVEFFRQNHDIRECQGRNFKRPGKSVKSVNSPKRCNRDLACAKCVNLALRRSATKRNATASGTFRLDTCIRRMTRILPDTSIIEVHQNSNILNSRIVCTPQQIDECRHWRTRLWDANP